ncbi:MAG: zinc ribbon domain-containing protein [Eubacterium sp.]|nr:zinc ribbon domain-containing protein [Eubacterium sp.]
MALINCPECGRSVSDKAISCPECGYPVREYETNTHKKSDNAKYYEGNVYDISPRWQAFVDSLNKPQKEQRYGNSFQNRKSKGYSEKNKIRDRIIVFNTIIGFSWIGLGVIQIIYFIKCLKYVNQGINFQFYLGDHFFSNTKAICIVGLIFGVLNAGSAIYDLSNMKNSKDNVLSLIEKAKVGFFDVLFFFWNGYLGLEFLRSQNSLDIFFGIIIGIAVLSDIIYRIFIGLNRGKINDLFS